MSLAVQWLRRNHPVQVVWVWFLVEELRYHIPKHKIEAILLKKTKTKKNKKQKPPPCKTQACMVSLANSLMK